MPELVFADATSTWEESDFAIFGVPFDKTSSFRAGSAEAPDAIREASHNFETFMPNHGEDIEHVRYCDLGNLDEYENADQMVREVEDFATGVIENGKFPIALGGEHSITPAIVKGFDDFCVITLDAHLDFREEYEGEKNSHACSTRRIADVVGVDKVIPIGVRSMSRQEQQDAQELGLRYITSIECTRQRKMFTAIDRALNLMGIERARVYLSLDMDVIDPAYAPGISNPEPFGLEPIEILRGIDMLADNLVGFDIVEVSPPYDNGNTSALAARLVREVIMAVWKAHI